MSKVNIYTDIEDICKYEIAFMWNQRNSIAIPIQKLFISYWQSDISEFEWNIFEVLILILVFLHDAGWYVYVYVVYRSISTQTSIRPYFESNENPN